MRILKRGELPEDRVYTATCQYCKTEIEFKQSEGKYTSDQRDGPFVSIPCPLCSRTIYKDAR